MSNLKEQLQSNTNFYRIGRLLQHIETQCLAASRKGQSTCQISFHPSGEQSLQELLGGEWQEKYMDLKRQRYNDFSEYQYQSFLTEVRNAIIRSTGLAVGDVSEGERLYEQVWWFSWR